MPFFTDVGDEDMWEEADSDLAVVPSSFSPFITDESGEIFIPTSMIEARDGEIQLQLPLPEFNSIQEEIAYNAAIARFCHDLVQALDEQKEVASDADQQQIPEIDAVSQPLLINENKRIDKSQEGAADLDNDPQVTNDTQEGAPGATAHGVMTASYENHPSPTMNKGQRGLRHYTSRWDVVDANTKKSQKLPSSPNKTSPRKERTFTSRWDVADSKKSHQSPSSSGNTASRAEHRYTSRLNMVDKDKERNTNTNTNTNANAKILPSVHDAKNDIQASRNPLKYSWDLEAEANTMRAMEVDDDKYQLGTGANAVQLPMNAKTHPTTARAMSMKRPATPDHDLYSDMDTYSNSYSDADSDLDIMTDDEFRAACHRLIDVDLALEYPTDKGTGPYVTVRDHIKWKAICRAYSSVGGTCVKLSMRMERFPYSTAYVPIRGREETEMLHEIADRYPLGYLDLQYADEGWDIGYGVKCKFHMA